MKKFNMLASAAGCCLMVALSGCMKDSCQKTYTIFRPIYKNLTQVRAEMKSQTPQPLVNTGKIYVFGKYIFLNEIQKGIHVIDNTNPANPKTISFIKIPGNVDIAVRGNYLYADCYSDIAVFDISNPTNVVAKKFMNNVIKDYSYYWGNNTDPDSVMVVVDYARKDTTVDCQTYNTWTNCRNCVFLDARGNTFSTTAGAVKNGTGGSMARFSVVNNYLYGVSSTSLYSIDITNATDPVLKKTKNLGSGIETIYPFRDKLFIGSTNGMFIYDISNPEDPSKLSSFAHVRSCDPVISDDNFAYVTLRSGNVCQGFTNQLEVLNVSNLSNPAKIKTYEMNNPHGLAKEDNTLFICDGKAGLKVYNAVDPSKLLLINTVTGIETYDVIAGNKLAIVVAKDGLYQYDYTNTSNIKLVSKINISK